MKKSIHATREQMLEHFLVRWTAKVRDLMGATWPGEASPERPYSKNIHRPQWEGFDQCFRELPPEQQLELARFAFDFWMDSNGVADPERLPKDDARVREAAAALSRAGDPVGISGNQLGTTWKFSDTRLAQALASANPEQTPDVIEAEVVKLASTSGALAPWSRRFVEQLLEQAPDESEDGRAAWLLDRFGIKITPRTLRTWDKR